MNGPRRSMVWGGIGAASLAAALAVVITRWVPTPPAAPPPGGPDLRTPQPATDFRLRSFSGPAITLSDYRGKFVVLNFWASWCGPCREEMPNLERTWQALRARGVIVLGINTADDYEDAAAFLSSLHITYPNAFDPEESRLTAYRVTGLPTTVFIDGQLRIRGLVAGGYVGPDGYQRLRRTILAVESSR